MELENPKFKTVPNGVKHLKLIYNNDDKDNEQISYGFLFLILFCGTKDWTQGLKHAWQKLLSLSNIPSPKSAHLKNY